MTGVAKLLTVLCRVFSCPVPFHGRGAVQRKVDGFPSASPCGRRFRRLSGGADRMSSRRPERCSTRCAPLAAPVCLCWVDTNVLDRECKGAICYCGTNCCRTGRNMAGYIQNVLYFWIWGYKTCKLKKRFGNICHILTMWQIIYKNLSSRSDLFFG